MEEANFQLTRHLRQFVDLEVLSWGGHQAWLPLVIPLFLLKSARILSRREVDGIHTGDALLSPLTLLLKALFSVPVTVTVYGLDITWSFPLYRSIVARSLNGLDKVVCISEETKRATIAAGVHARKIVTIPLGVSPTRFKANPPKSEARRVVESQYGLDLTERWVLLSVGRFVRRKGFLWFLEAVLPRLIKAEKNIVYFLVGYGPLEDAIEGVIRKRDLEGHVFVVRDTRLDDLYAAADLFVMPNVPVEGDMEGFGIVALEAAASGLPVVASRLEGIKDAIVEGRNGLLITPLDSEQFARTILRLLSDDGWRVDLGQSAREFTLTSFNWATIAENYAGLFSNLLT